MNPEFSRTLAVAGILAAAGLLSAADAQAQSYPACLNPSQTNCAMSDVNNGPVMTGTVNVYVIFYGAWNTTIDGTIAGLIPSLIQDLNDSSYSAVAATYTSPSGPVSGLLHYGGAVYDTGEHLGKTLSDTSANSSIQSEIGWTITNRFFPEDANGLYLLLPFSDVTVNSQCGYLCGGGESELACGCNSNSTTIVSGVNIKYAVVGDTNSSNCACRWGYHTANDAQGEDLNGVVDAELSAIAHEIFERITDPEQTTGWWSSSTNPNTQMADFCAWEGDPWTNVYDPPDNPTAVANFRGRSNDFYLQPLRVNSSGGAFGYCSTTYGGVFWDQNYGMSWSPVGDWSYDNYKGECESGQPLTGISESSSSPNTGHAVYCGNGPTSSLFGQSNQCIVSVFDGLGGTLDNYGEHGNWDPGYYVDECAPGYFAAGVSQSQGGRVNALLCCPGTGAGIRSTSCVKETAPSSIPGIDWDRGFWKAQCPVTSQTNLGIESMQYVVGVSATPSTGGMHAIYCCSP
jgi:hypothetical protein